MAISPQRLTIYLYSAHRAVIFAIAQLSRTWLSLTLDLCILVHVSRVRVIQNLRQRICVVLVACVS